MGVEETSEGERLRAGDFIVNQAKMVQRTMLKVCPCCGAELLKVTPETATSGEIWDVYFYACRGRDPLAWGEVGRLMVFPAPTKVTILAEGEDDMPEVYVPSEWGIGRWDVHCPAVDWRHAPRDGWAFPPLEDQ